MGCKIETVCASRGMPTLPDRLVDRRVDAGDSLRDLERFFNREVLAAAMRDAGMELLEGEAENVHRLLTDEDVSDAARTEARDRLRRAGVDVDAVRDDFVTYGTVRTHLRECAGVETGRESSVDAASVRDTAFGLFGRAEAITEREVSRLAETESFDAGDVTVSLTARVTCETCGEEYGLLRLLDRGGCGCRRED
ncbi:rod-determining factor RdfA [Haloplanus salilacus]|uniref:rod-determining factor RdfA n=1 Tax=Haloplanus salilacus TaxID=2949994 RepID=UPI0030D5EDE5